ncbi:hypothetical protein CSUI_001622 [Cystoisospora suis]|uniref:Uncharacterized protein n=1 Tax=Cystoisospora suis TaxID=483139 RepID=A0A2C6L7W6_9APIC|nr:hypothetical protein CSUI_001622 [Cystoisospora suis]
MRTSQTDVKIVFESKERDLTREERLPYKDTPYEARGEGENELSPLMCVRDCPPTLERRARGVGVCRVTS